MIGWLRTCVRKQPIIGLYFESENELKFYNFEAWFIFAMAFSASAPSLVHWWTLDLINWPWLILSSSPLVHIIHGSHRNSKTQFHDFSMIFNDQHNVISIIQLMHSFEDNIRICQPKNSDVHRGEAEVNITFEGWLILMLTEKECTNCFVIWHCLSFIFIFINLLKTDVPRKIISTIYFPNFCNSYEIHV